MFWLTWRQFRLQAWVTGAALAAFAIALAATAAHLNSLYDSSGITTCHGTGDCGTAAASFLVAVRSSQADMTVYNLGLGIVFAVPVISGLFWGAPLITREFEAGTFRLAWNQSVTRTRWLAVKLGLTGLIAMASAGLVILMTSWWASPLYHAAGLAETRNGADAINRFALLQFGSGGIVPVGYAALAFTLGVTAGLLIRRTVPAMAVTLAIFAALQVATPLWIRPHFQAPLTATTALDPQQISGMAFSAPHMTVLASVSRPGAWVLGNVVTHADGQVFSGPPPKACESPAFTFRACGAALGKLHLRQVVTYQPASRYWAFQWYETALYLVLAGALAGFCFWRIRPRRLN
jgi:hypothetical protein